MLWKNSFKPHSNGWLCFRKLEKAIAIKCQRERERTRMSFVILFIQTPNWMVLGCCDGVTLCLYSDWFRVCVRLPSEIVAKVPIRKRYLDYECLICNAMQCDLRYSLSQTNWSETKACSRTFSDCDYFHCCAPHFVNSRINFIGETKTFHWKCYFSVAKRKIGLKRRSNFQYWVTSSNKNEWNTKRFRAVTFTCYRMKIWIFLDKTQQTLQFSIHIHTCCSNVAVHQKVPNTTKINHDFIYARKSTNSLKIELDMSKPSNWCMNMAALSWNHRRRKRARGK